MISTRTEFIKSVLQLIQDPVYLEIGIGNARNFNSVSPLCAYSIAVDPDRNSIIKVINGVNEQANVEVWNMSSDKYFEDQIGKVEYEVSFFDLIFIDGLHHKDQVLRDIHNALQVLKPLGIILVHDIMPITKDMQEVPQNGRGIWTGDVWKAWLELRKNYNINQWCYPHDYGIGIITKVIPGSKSITNTFTIAARLKKSSHNWNPNYGDYIVNYKDFLNVMPGTPYETIEIPSQ